MELVRWVLSDSDEYEMIVGPAGGIYTARVSRKRYAQWAFSMMDFIGFHESVGNRPQILAPAQAVEEARALYCGHCFDERALRPWESPVMVHSTTPEGYDGIMRDGCLRSWNDLHVSGNIVESEPIGAVLGDPAALKDYIMLGGGRSPEIVVASREAGMLVMDETAVYRPGARLYLDARKLAEDGLLVRDGCHRMARGRIPLDWYLIKAVTASDVPEDANTPAAFADAADRVYEEFRRRRKNEQ